MAGVHTPYHWSYPRQIRETTLKPPALANAYKIEAASLGILADIKNSAQHANVVPKGTDA